MTSNIWSHSGLNEETEAHNVIRFERSNGTVIHQNQSSTLASTMTGASVNGVTEVTANLANAFSSST